jgi:hypothetical protein
MSNRPVTLVNYDTGVAYKNWMHAIISILYDGYVYHCPICKTLRNIKCYIPKEEPEETTIKEEKEMKNEQVKVSKINSLPRWAELNDRDWLKEYKDLSTRTKLLNDYAAYRRRRERELMMYSEEGERSANAYTAEVLGGMSKRYDLRYVGNDATDKMVAIVDLDPCCNEAGFIAMHTNNSNVQENLRQNQKEYHEYAAFYAKVKNDYENEYIEYRINCMENREEALENDDLWLKEFGETQADEYERIIDANTKLMEDYSNAERAIVRKLIQKEKIFKAAATASKKYNYMLLKSKNN